ncbi:LacI family DNA-binding transcriptional regulator [Pengzhenrongella sicca]|uniref:LacI family DNA-binding transcriptional regulator n=1 Tax=Pengzhenrongella sicca TaxID=2819238 RepID=A0A8A4ZDU1_9MICO|nr:LacI family DNA-binding transcriptional regulator [Pengzhenrongella sicca]QTE29189.1 LacI family DNA-binding transcriptional regulator [Pengzhenrongella sicca]
MPTKGRKPSQRDIARLAGVSQAAVSMVVNGKADQYHLAATTQDRVRAAMLEVSYVPSVAGRSLRGGRSGLLGVHTYESVFPVAVDDYYHEFLVGIEQAAVRARQDLILFASTQSADGTRSIYTRSGNRLNLADGAVILGSQQSNEEIARLAAEGYPFVYVGRREIPGVNLSFVTAEYAGGVRSVLDAVAAAGHERVAYLAGANAFGPLLERRSGFSAGVQALALHGTIDVVDPPESLDAPRLRAMVGAGITALLVESPELGRALATAAEAAGLTIPSELTIVALDHADNPMPWSRLAIPRREMGARAIELLLELLDDPDRTPRSAVLACGPLDLVSIAEARPASPRPRSEAATPLS